MIKIRIPTVTDVEVNLCTNPSNPKFGDLRAFGPRIEIFSADGWNPLETDQVLDMFNPIIDIQSSKGFDIDACATASSTHAVYWTSEVASNAKLTWKGKYDEDNTDYLTGDVVVNDISSFFINYTAPHRSISWVKLENMELLKMMNIFLELNPNTQIEETTQLRSVRV